MTAEHSMRCVAQTGWGARCRRFGDIRVTATGGRVCRQHHRFGWTPHRLPDDVEVDPRVAARAAAVLGADLDRRPTRQVEPEEDDDREPGPAAEAFAELGRDLGARLVADRAVLHRRLNRGPAAVFTAKNCNRKLSPVELVDVGRRFKQPRVRAPYCSTTFASIQASCPDSCRFKMKQGRSNGCFADAGFTAMRSRRYDRAAAGLSALEVIAQEAREIRQAFGGGRIPQDGMKGGRDLRLHVGGDAPTVECAQLLGGAAADWQRRGGGAVWTYTHAFRAVPRAAWGPAVAVLASIEHGSEVAAARAQGYAPALVVDRFPRGHRKFRVGGVDFIPCLAETRNLTCVECRVCFGGVDLFKRKLGIAFQVHGQHEARAREALRSAGADPKRLAGKRALAVVR
jgi:hypothetical protein